MAKSRHSYGDDSGDQPVYDAEQSTTTSTASDSSAAGQSATTNQQSKNPLASLDTGYLQRAKGELLHAIPSDPTFMAVVGTLLRALVTHALSDADRKAVDEKVAKLNADAQEKQARDQLAAKQEFERGHLPPPGTPDADAAHAALDSKHTAELNELDRQKALAALAERQRQEHADLLAKHAGERDSLSGATTPATQPAATAA